jgi:plasmid stabilization system protein ParE
VTRVIYSDRAKAALWEILLFIGERDPNAALRLLDDLERRLDEVLTQFPEAGPRTAGGERVLAIRRYPFVYRHDAAKGEVVVLEVFGPGMDWR